MNIPCKECLAFPCCRNRITYNPKVAFLLDLRKCEIFKGWSGDSYNRKKKEIIKECFKVIYVI